MGKRLSSPIGFVDCSIDAKAAAGLRSNRVFSTNPLAAFSLARHGIEAVGLQELCGVDDVLGVHRRVGRIVRELRVRLEATALTRRYPNAFQLHAYHLHILFFSLLSKLCALTCAFARVQPDGSGGPALLITNASEVSVPSYPVREDDALYAWLVTRLAAVRGFELESREVRSVDDITGNGTGALSVRALVDAWGGLLRKSRCLRWPVASTAPAVLGWRSYQATHLPDSLLSERGLAWRQPRDLLAPLGNQIALRQRPSREPAPADQQALNAAVIDALERVLTAELEPEQRDMLQPIAEPIAASLSDHVAQSVAVDEYLSRTRPVAFVSSSLSGSLPDRLLALVCRRRGIPVIGLQHGGNYGELDERCAGLGITLYLEELELCDEFVAWGSATADALSRAQSTYRPSTHHARVIAGGPVSIPLPRDEASGPGREPRSLSSVLYLPHAVQINVVRTAWLGGWYMEHVLAMCAVLSRCSTKYDVTVKFPAVSNVWQPQLHHELRHRYPDLRIVTSEATVAELTGRTDLAVIDVPATSLCELLPLPLQIATVELFADMYPGHQLVKPEALELLRRRCLVAPTYAGLRSLVERCLGNPEDTIWPDMSCHDFFHQFVRNPADRTGLEAYAHVLNSARSRQSLALT